MKTFLEYLEHDAIAYEQFYCKSGRTPWKAINIKSPLLLAESILSQCIHFPAGCLCAYSMSSYMNILRAKQPNMRFLDERDRMTAPTAEFGDMLEAYCQAHAAQHAVAPEIDAYDPDSSKTIYGNIMLKATLDTSKRNIDKHIDVLSRKALLLGYNYVAHEVHKVKDNAYVLDMQFEASYFSANVKYGDIIWHLAPKSAIGKILKTGLVPSSKCSKGFSYPDRVYFFIDRDDKLMAEYAKASGKQSKLFIPSKKLANEIKSFYDEIEKKDYGILFDTHEFCILKVDTAKMGDVKLYRDCTFDVDGSFVAVFADQAIPPKAIKLVGEVNA